MFLFCKWQIKDDEHSANLHTKKQTFLSCHYSNPSTHKSFSLPHTSDSPNGKKRESLVEIGQCAPPTWCLKTGVLKQTAKFEMFPTNINQKLSSHIVIPSLQLSFSA